MKLRSILSGASFYSLLAFLSACVAGYLYYSFIKEYAFQEAERNALNRLQTTKKNLVCFFFRKHQTRSDIGWNAALVDVLSHPDPTKLENRQCPAGSV
jgi:hypothetical protein